MNDNWTIPRAAVIPTNGRECVEQCLDAIMPQVDFAIVVETKKHHGIKYRPGAYKHWYDEGDINISAWWQAGLDEAQWRIEHGTGPLINLYLASERRKWDVAILNDDAIVPEGWFTAVASKMREMKAAAASSNAHITMPVLYTHPGPIDLFARMNGFAFIVRGELEMRPNKMLTWYFSDDHMDWQARELGGVVVIPGFPVNHLYPNGQVTPQIQEQIAQDAQEFVHIWGMRPW